MMKVSSEKKKHTSVVGYLPKKLRIDAKNNLEQKLLKLFVNDFQPFKIVEVSVLNNLFRHLIQIMNYQTVTQYQKSIFRPCMKSV